MGDADRTMYVEGLPNLTALIAYLQQNGVGQHWIDGLIEYADEIVRLRAEVERLTPKPWPVLRGK